MEIEMRKSCTEEQRFGGESVGLLLEKIHQRPCLGPPRLSSQMSIWSVFVGGRRIKEQGQFLQDSGGCWASGPRPP